ncbi:MAG: heavy metal translocating P-type ATPase metal-binding domain-containing protein [Ferruginibacter sp.]
MNKTTNITNCFHCGEKCHDGEIALGEKSFCCSGCKTVYQVLQQNNLDNYYCLNENPGVTIKEIAPSKFHYLTDDTIVKKLISFRNQQQTQVSFFLPQIHCSSCLWLLENLRKVNENIISSQVNFSSKQLSVSFDHNSLSLKELAELLTSIGYEPHISMQDAEEKESAYSPKKTAYKLGVVGFCFANIMLVSFPEYLGLEFGKDPTLASFFRYVNLVLALPVFFYGAKEFFVNAFYSFQQKYLNIDAPIALAVLITFGRSVYEILTGTGAGYLDSMSGIVFFMLIGRTLQNRTYSTLKFNRDYKSYFPIAVTRLENFSETICRLQDIKENDILLLHHQEIIPVDGLLSKGSALIDYSFITGENTPSPINTGEIMYAGGKVISGNLEMVSVASFNQSNFTKLWNNKAFKNEQNDRKAFTTVLSQYFSLIVFAIAASAFVYWQLNDASRAWNALTAVLIVACPCSLLLSATFTYGYTIDLFSQNGFFVKNTNSIEQLTKINHIVFDKTGTLTEASELPVNVLQTNWTPAEKELVLSVMAQSIHPMSRAIVKHYGDLNRIRIENFKEERGLGIEAWVNERHIKIGSAVFVQQYTGSLQGSRVYVSIDKKIKAVFEIENKVKAGVHDLMQKLDGFSLSLLSGDNEHARAQMEQIFPKRASLLFARSPQQKLDYVQELQQQGDHVLMLGDGLNDAGALMQSNVGISVVENSFSFSPACDAVMDSKNIGRLQKFIRAAKSSKNLIITGFAYSVLYNIAGLYFATTAQLQPVLAAIIMPLSSIGIVMLSFFGTKLIGRKLAC